MSSSLRDYSTRLALCLCKLDETKGVWVVHVAMPACAVTGGILGLGIEGVESKHYLDPQSMQNNSLFDCFGSLFHLRLKPRQGRIGLLSLG